MIRVRIKKLFRLALHRREDAERDVRDEIGLHIALRTEQLIVGGLAPELARAEAERKFGSAALQREMQEAATHREDVMRRRDWTEAFMQDLRYVLRSLKRSPTFVISATLTLALGLGANAALFSILDRLFLQTPPGIVTPQQLHRFYSTFTLPNGELTLGSVISPPQYLAVETALPSGSVMAGYRKQPKVRLGKDDNAPLGGVSWVLGDYFGTLGVRTSYGRTFTAEEVRAENIAPVAIVSSDYAKAQFGSERDALNKYIDIGSIHLLIVGVAPPGFRGIDLEPMQVWAPMSNFVSQWLGATRWWEETGTGFISVVMRAHDKATLAAFLPRAASALRQMPGMRGDTSAIGSQVGSINAMLSPGFDSSTEAIATRLAVVAFAILLIACANVANLLLARALQRRREIGVRLALGVSRMRLMSQLLTESVVLAVIGGVAALIMAVWCATALRHALLPTINWQAPAIGVRALTFGAITTVLAGFLAGLAPALHATSPSLSNVLKGGARDGTNPRSRVRNGLLVAQVALSCLLLAGAGLFVRSLRQVESIDIGYDTGRIVFAGIDFARGSGHLPSERGLLLSDATERIKRLPGVERVAATENTPLQGFSFDETFLQSGDTLPHLDDMLTIVSFISQGYFASMGMHVLQGRDFSADDKKGAEQVIVVNSKFAKTVWPGEPAIGKCVRLSKPTEPCRRVVGVVSDAHFGGVIEKPSMQFFVPLLQGGDGGREGVPGTLEIRTADGAATTVAAQVKRLLTQMSGAGMIPWAQTFSEQLDPSFRNWRLGAALFGVAGLLALLVAGVGIYGTIAYTFSQRTQEIGVRIALGAQGSSIVALVLKSSLMISGIGVVLGAVTAVWAGRFAKPLLYDTAPDNPFVLGGVALLLLGVAVIASLVPALRAKRVDPMEALRAE